MQKRTRSPVDQGKYAVNYAFTIWYAIRLLIAPYKPPADRFQKVVFRTGLLVNTLINVLLSPAGHSAYLLICLTKIESTTKY
jgi:hypothetical protein